MTKFFINFVFCSLFFGASYIRMIYALPTVYETDNFYGKEHEAGETKRSPSKQEEYDDGNSLYFGKRAFMILPGRNSGKRGFMILPKPQSAKKAYLILPKNVPSTRTRAEGPQYVAGNGELDSMVERIMSLRSGYHNPLPFNYRGLME